MKKEQQFVIDEKVDDYLITLHNITERGLGLRIKAGANIDPDSAAILSVADMHNDNKFIVKSNGNVVSYYNHMIGNILISDSSIENTNNNSINFNSPLTLCKVPNELLEEIKENVQPGSVISLVDQNYKPAYYDGTHWRYFSNDEIVQCQQV